MDRLVVRRRRLRQDRGRAARRVRRGARRAAGRGRLPDDAARAPALRRLPRPLRRPAGRGPPAVAASSPPRGQGDARRARRRHDRHRRRHPRAPRQVGRVQAPRPGHRRRGAALRRHPQGAAEEPQGRRPRPDADRDADPAHAADGADGPARAVDHRDPAGRPPGGPHLRHAVGRGRPARGAAARALPRRAELLRHPQDRRPARHREVPAQVRARGQASSPPTARWRRPRSRSG